MIHLITELEINIHHLQGNAQCQQAMSRIP